MLEELAKRELTRREFLLLIVSLLIGVMGIGRLLNLGNGSNYSKTPRGFSAGAYGK